MKNRFSIKLNIVYVGLLFLVGCATTTKPGVVGVSREQFLIASPTQIESSAAQGYAQLNNQARQQNKLILSGQTYNRLHNIKNRLAQQTNVFRSDRAWQWELTLIDSPDVNAACLPGGKIIFYTGLIQQLQLTDAEIAAVMAHEMAHALREHGRERVSRAMAQGLVVDIAAGYTNNAQFANQVMYYALALPNSREAESEADRIGLELMARAGYDPRAAIALHQKMSSQRGQPPEFLSSHPSWSTRVSELNSIMPAVMPLYQMAAKP